MAADTTAASGAAPSARRADPATAENGGASHAPVDTAAWPLLLAVRDAVEVGAKAEAGLGEPSAEGCAPDARQLLELFLPLALTSRRAGRITAVLGQTLDGFIATHDGDSRYINGAGGLAHLHRLRALSDAVLVGASTAVIDRPRLTTRLVEGPNPTRVVIDPRGRLPETHPLLHDGAAPTLVLRAADGAAASPGRDEPISDQARLVWIEAGPGGRLDPARIVAALRQRGLTRLLVEGGGDTVSRFLAAACLDALHLLVAPVILGAGRPALSLPPCERVAAALRPACRPHLLDGGDVLFDLRFDPACQPALAS